MHNNAWYIPKRLEKRPSDLKPNGTQKRHNFPARISMLKDFSFSLPLLYGQANCKFLQFELTKYKLGDTFDLWQNDFFSWGVVFQICVCLYQVFKYCLHNKTSRASRCLSYFQLMIQRAGF